MKRNDYRSLLIAGLSFPLSLSPFALAADTIYAGMPIEGGVTVTAQHADDGRIDDEALLSLDLLTTLPMGPGEWSLYLEGNSSPQNDGVSTTIGEANGDAGSALDRNDHGRLQVSELHYTLPAGDASLTLGLMDTSAFLDGSRVANDETSQFLGTTLVNNPTIEFPDYTLGVAYSRDLLQDSLALTMVVAGSHGIGDNPDRSWSQLLELDRRHKGVFAAIEFGYGRNDLYLRAGGWLHSGDHARLDGSGDGRDSNAGLYASIDGTLTTTHWNLRLGVADDEVSQASEFIGLAVEQPLRYATLGAGITRTGLSDQGAGSGQDDITQAELYLRHDYSDRLHLAPSLQWIENSGFDSSGSSHDARQTIFSLRAHYSF